MPSQYFPHFASSPGTHPATQPAPTFAMSPGCPAPSDIDGVTTGTATTLTGQIARVLFEAPDGPFAAITVTTDAGSIRAVGALTGVSAGQ